jgi:3'(2'), 5'-bisphosphate nucleotidase
MQVLEREIEVALAAARAAAELIRGVYSTDFAVEWKGHRDPVTEADKRANALIVEALTRAFPDDHVCAEEGEAAQSSRAASRGGRCWFVDPLDGTREFVDRNGEFCVMVGLAIDGAAALGVVVAPVWEREFVGVVGQGAWELTGDARRALHATVVTDASRASLVVSRSHPHPRLDALSSALGIASKRPCGSVGIKVALVATGEVSAYVHIGGGPKLWDGCAPEAIARGAGAEVTDAQGRALRYDTADLALSGGIVVAAPPLAATLRSALAAG